MYSFGLMETRYYDQAEKVAMEVSSPASHCAPRRPPLAKGCTHTKRFAHTVALNAKVSTEDISLFFLMFQFPVQYNFSFSPTFYGCFRRVHPGGGRRVWP